MKLLIALILTFLSVGLFAQKDFEYYNINNRISILPPDFNKTVSYESKTIDLNNTDWRSQINQDITKTLFYKSIDNKTISVRSVNSMRSVYNLSSLNQVFEAKIGAFINGEGYPDNSGLVPLDSGSINVCFGDSVLLKGSGDFPNSLESGNAGGYSQTNDNCSYRWDIGELQPIFGDSIWFKIPERNGYIVRLTMTDAQGLSNVVTARIVTATRPEASALSIELANICIGESIELEEGAYTDSLESGVSSTTGVFRTGGIVADTTFLDDRPGFTFTSTIPIEGFNELDTLTNPSDIVSICASLEHTWLGDLEAWIECPNGKTATLFDASTYSRQQIPGGFDGSLIDLGTPITTDNEDTGEGYEYCWLGNEADATFGTFEEVHTADGFVRNGNNANAMPEGSYRPRESFSNLIGCPLNGDWTINIPDNATADQGYIFYWKIDFAGKFYDNLDSYEMELTNIDWFTEYDFSQTDSSKIVTPNETGEITLTAIVENNFGCVDSLDIDMTVNPEIELVTVTENCDKSLDLTMLNSQEGGIWSYDSTIVSITDNGDNTYEALFEDIGLFEIAYKDQRCRDSLKHSVLINNIPELSVEDMTICAGQADTLTVDSAYAFNVVYSWSTNASIPGDTLGLSYIAEVQGDYTLSANNFCGETSVTSSVREATCNFPNVMLIGGDPANDCYFIDGIERWPNTKFTVFNRWGNAIFDSDNYQNDWCGQIKDTNREAAEGVYFFSLQRSIDEEPIKGYINLIRE